MLKETSITVIGEAVGEVLDRADLLVGGADAPTPF
jgi:hypothetical protein